MNRASVFEQAAQAEPCQRFLATSADEFAADAVARIMSGFAKRHRNFLLPQPDAQRKSGEAAADNRDGFWRRHLFEPLRDENVAE